MKYTYTKIERFISPDSFEGVNLAIVENTDTNLFELFAVDVTIGFEDTLRLLNLGMVQSIIEYPIASNFIDFFAIYRGYSDRGKVQAIILDKITGKNIDFIKNGGKVS